MRDGLKIIQIPGRYGYSVTRIAWMRRIAGDEWELVPGARTIVRTAGARTLDSLASEGPKTDHRLTEPAKGTEEIHRLLLRRTLPADLAVWERHCPRPEGFAS